MLTKAWVTCLLNWSHFVETFSEITLKVRLGTQYVRVPVRFQSDQLNRMNVKFEDLGIVLTSKATESRSISLKVSVFLLYGSSIGQLSFTHGCRMSVSIPILSSSFATNSFDRRSWHSAKILIEVG